MLRYHPISLHHPDDILLLWQSDGTSWKWHVIRIMGSWLYSLFNCYYGIKLRSPLLLTHIPQIPSDISICCINILFNMASRYFRSIICTRNVQNIWSDFYKFVQYTSNYNDCPFNSNNPVSDTLCSLLRYGKNYLKVYKRSLLFIGFIIK